MLPQELARSLAKRSSFYSEFARDRRTTAFRVLIRRFVYCHELVVGTVEWLAKPVYARQDRVMAMHNGPTEALDSHDTLWPSAAQQCLRR